MLNYCFIIHNLQQAEAPPAQVVGQPFQPAYGSYGGSGYGGSGYGGSGGGSGFYCFTADSMVKLSNGEIKQMDKLSVGDWVMTENNTQVKFFVTLEIFLS